MDIDTTKIRELLDRRDALDQELASLIGGTKERKPQRCSICSSTEHSARTCPQKKPE